ncbi:MAG: DUF58 domain-containing protein [Armatimonadota bacterium]
MNNTAFVILSLRFACVLVAAAVLVGLSGRLAPLAGVGMVTIGFGVVLVILDWRRLAGQRLEVTRSCDEKLSLGARNVVRLSVHNPNHTRISGRIRDEYPEGFRVDRNELPLDLPPRSGQDLTYRVIPAGRGDYEFGDIYVRVDGPFGFVTRQIRFPARSKVKVYPNLLDIRRYEIGARRERPLGPGHRRIRIRGRGTDFESLRDYVPDDEFRSIDWKATARRGKLTTRQYQEERSQNVVIALDCGRVMGSVVPVRVGESGEAIDLTRLDHCINAAVMLGHVVARKGDRVALMAFAEDVLAYLPPKAGRSQVLNVLRLTYNLKEASGDSDYGRAARFMVRKWSRRSLIVLFTDLVDPDSSKALITQIAGLARKHLCLIVAMSDPEVLAAARGPFESPEQAFRAAAARQVLYARRQAAASITRHGAIVLDLPADRLTASVVEQYLDIKALGLL